VADQKTLLWTTVNTESKDIVYCPQRWSKYMNVFLVLAHPDCPG